MWALGPIGFLAPGLLFGLITLPAIWLLLRAVPPAAVRRRFPGVALLIGLTDDEVEADRTPWWLLALRIAALGLLIFGFAGPVLNPTERTPGSGPLLVLFDAGWSSAPDWSARLAQAELKLREAAEAGRAAAVVVLTHPPVELRFVAAQDVAQRLPGLLPQPHMPDVNARDWLSTHDGTFDTYWLSGGLGYEGQEALLTALEARGSVTVFETEHDVTALRAPRLEDGAIAIEALRAAPSEGVSLEIEVVGRDPAGIERVLIRQELAFEPGATVANAATVLPTELRNRITRLEISGVRSAGAVALTDDSLRRREVALISARDDRESLDLLSPTHFLERALAPAAEILSGALGDILPANPDAIILADVAALPEADRVLEWVEAGGLLVRFAGPILAASDAGRIDEDPLLPVRLRAGGRSVGGAMSWGQPKMIAPFAVGSPFFGLEVPQDVTVTAQVLAQPGPELSSRVIASLSDGTPIVTRRSIGAGQVVLFHITANAEWSSLALSGLFVEMLERLAVSARTADPSDADLAGRSWAQEQGIDGFGTLSTPTLATAIPGEILAEARASAEAPPGLYRSGDQVLAHNVLRAEDTLNASEWPARIPVEGTTEAQETPLKGLALAIALGLLTADVFATLWVSGRLFGPRVVAGFLAAAVAVAVSIPEETVAQEASDGVAIAATRDVVLAHVVTGDAALDARALAGLEGLSRVLTARTSIEPAAPIGINLETDEIAYFPFLYWPISPDQRRPSDAAYARLNRYLANGGMILFDTHDADRARFGASSPEGRRLQELAAPLDIPRLERIPGDHVLTRAFYLLQDFPGRHASADVWVEAAPAEAERVEGMPFRNLNDGVTPVVAGGNDWASAWAVGSGGAPLYPVGRGIQGERQRELAFRFGVNLIMHVLTGNYKSDQVHVPALLDRLGQ
ncbi:MAG: DUF4159 domain-containing protein [Pseudomonadota bacterium]